MAQLPKQDAIALEMYEAALRGSLSGDRGYLGMSQVGKACERSLWLEFRGFPRNPVDGRVSMIFEFGNQVEALIIKWLEAAGYRVTGAQDEFVDHGGYFRGHCDGIIHRVSSRPHVLEIKSANDTKFKALKQGGVASATPIYHAQLQCYMGYTGLERGLLVAMNKNTCEIYTERVYFSEETFVSLKEKARRIICSESAPVRGFVKDSLDCRWCSVSAACWYPEEVALAEAACGTCHYMGFVECRPVCRYPLHAFVIRHWGIGCPDWRDRFEKGGDTLPKATDDQVAT